MIFSSHLHNYKNTLMKLLTSFMWTCVIMSPISEIGNFKIYPPHVNLKFPISNSQNRKYNTCLPYEAVSSCSFIQCCVALIFLDLNAVYYGQYKNRDGLQLDFRKETLVNVKTSIPIQHNLLFPSFIPIEHYIEGHTYHIDCM